MEKQEPEPVRSGPERTGEQAAGATSTATRVLLVGNIDDFPPLLQEALRGANAAGIDVEVSGSVAQAMHQLGGSSFDAVLIDLTSEGEAAEQVVSSIQDRQPTTAILVLGDGDDEAGLHLVRSGAQDYLVKSRLGSELLSRSVKYAVERKRAEKDRAIVAQRERAERALLLEVLRQMLKGVIIAEVPSGRLILGNKQMKIIWRHSFIPAADVSEYGAYKAFHSDGTPFAPEDWPLARSVLRGEVVTDEEIEFLRGDGTRGIMRISSAPVFDQGGRAIAAVASFYDVTERKATEVELRRYAERLSAMSRQLTTVQEEERRYIARELHDEVGQALTALKISLQAAQAGLDLAAAMPRLTDGVAIADHILGQVRNLALDLRPTMLDDLGLVSALRWYLKRLAERTDLEVRFSLAEGLGRLPSPVETACFRIAQEALTNALRHGHPRQVTVQLLEQAGELQLAVHDEGAGFDIEAVRAREARGESLGLLGMQERAEALGGRLEVESEPGRGTTVTAHFPLPALDQ